MSSPPTEAIQIRSPNIRHSHRVTLQVEGAESFVDALKIVREWAEDVANHEGMAHEVTATAAPAPPVE